MYTCKDVFKNNFAFRNLMLYLKTFTIVIAINKNLEPVRKLQFDSDTVSSFLFMNALMNHSHEDRSKL